jgi:hypothetical protein
MTRTLMLVLAALASLTVATSALGSASRSSQPSLKVRPSAVRPNGTVHISGRAGTCAKGSRLTATSLAFPESLSGSGALVGHVHKNHTFSFHGYVRGNVTAGHYTVTASCGGSDLGVTVNLRVK